jgi:hypothetical protein
MIATRLNIFINLIKILQATSRSEKVQVPATDWKLPAVSLKGTGTPLPRKFGI